jgi:predicted HTH transcriptional regulator
MDLPPWADTAFSQLLPDLIAGGEAQEVEFKVSFPERNAEELCKSLAAFATSGGGWILIGVHNEGHVVGLDSTTDKIREQHVLRIKGLLRNVKPSVKIQELLLGDADGCVLGIRIHQEQEKPIYYYDHRPYIRDGRESRPATPEEVQERVWAHPSSEDKRRTAELHYQIAKNAVDASQRHQENMHRSTRRFQDQQAQLRADMSRKILGEN